MDLWEILLIIGAVALLLDVAIVMVIHQDEKRRHAREFRAIAIRWSDKHDPRTN